MSRIRRERLIESSWLAELSGKTLGKCYWSCSSDMSRCSFSMRTESGWYVVHVRDRAEDCTMSFVEHYES